jgi:membrane-bound lytic murein transglycosylase A
MAGRQVGPTKVLVSAMMVLLASCTAPRTRDGSVGAPSVLGGIELAPVNWAALPGWAGDDLTAAWPAFVASCGSKRLPAAWNSICESARSVDARDAVTQRRLFESRLRPYRVAAPAAGKASTQDSGLITGYYEPVLRGARKRGAAFQTPLFATPNDLVSVELGELYPTLKGERLRGRLDARRVVPYPDRAALIDGSLLSDKVLAWVDDPIDAFFLQVQGSGRVELTDGEVIRLAFADVNGHPYRSIGRYLVERGELTLEQATAPGIRAWLKIHPERQAEVFNSNPSVVFFREQALGDPSVGPRGALGVPLTAGRSIAIDPRLLPLGAPLFLATTHPLDGAPLQRLVLAQDTGGAIRGALRADLFWGLGAQAGELAGNMRQTGALWLLWPAGSALPAN